MNREMQEKLVVDRRSAAAVSVTLYRYVDPQGNLRDHGKRVLGSWKPRHDALSRAARK